MKSLVGEISKLKASSFVRNTATLVSGTAAAQIIAVAAMPILSRLYSPTDFGLLALFLAVAGIGATFFTLRYESCILLPKSDDEAATLVLLCCLLVLILGSFSFTFTLLLPQNIREWVGLSSLGFWFPVAVLSGMAMATLAIGTSWLNRKRAYVEMAKIRITQTVVGVIFSVIVGMYGMYRGLIIGQIIGVFVAATIAIVFLPALRSYCKKSRVFNLAMKNNAAPKYLLPTALLDIVTLQLPVFLIAAWFTVEKAGQFSLAWRILALPIGLVGGAIGQVFLQRFSETWPEVLTAKKLLFRTWIFLAVAGISPTVFIIIFGEQLFVWMLGDSWGEAGKMASIIAPMLLAIFVSSPTSGAYLVLGLQRYSLYFGIAVLIYRPLCLSLGLITGNVLDGLLALAIAEIFQIFIYQLILIRGIVAAS